MRRVRHRRKRDALTGCQLGERARSLAEHRQQAEMRRRRHLAGRSQLRRDGSHDERNDLQNIARGLPRLIASHLLGDLTIIRPSVP